MSDKNGSPEAVIEKKESNPEKERALSAALAQIERQFGKGSMMRLGDEEQVAIPSISTGSLGLDVALGIGGLPKGRVVEIYGRIIWQNNAYAPSDCRGSESRRYLRIH